MEHLSQTLLKAMIEIPRGDSESQTKFLQDFIEKPEGVYDDYGNYYIRIGESDVMFTSHVDTVHRAGAIKHTVVEEGDFLTTTDGTCLGADCTTGIYIMLNMIENKVPGTYAFFRDEEKGCLGSSWAAEHLQMDGVNHCISFDRMGYDSIITHQCGMQTASYEFSEELAKRFNTLASDAWDIDLGFQLDDGGVFTDSNEFAGKIPNCTNLSVGYFNQHTKLEEQDLAFLEIITEVYCTVDWSNLPIGTINKTTNWMESDFEDEMSNYYAHPVLDQIHDLMWEHPDVCEDIEQDLQVVLDKYDVSSPFHVG